MKTRAAAAAASIMTVLGVSAGVAWADPPLRPGEVPATISCDDGSTRSVVIAPGNGSWTPGLDTGSNRVYIPLGFDGFHGVATDADTGEVLATFDDPSVEMKKAAPRGRTILHCTFTQSFYSPDDPDFGRDVVYEIGGGVIGFVTR